MSVPMSRTWKIVLVVSVALNLFLAAVIATAWLKNPRSRGGGLANAPFSMPWAARVLGKETRPMAREIFRARFPEFTGVREALIADSRNLAQILEQPQFARAEFEAALARLKGNTDAAIASNHAAMADFAERITAAQRQQLADAIEKYVDRREARFKRWQERREAREEGN